MRIGAAGALLLAVTIACGGTLFRQYEYEEDLYLSLDGSATLYVNGSTQAINALRGTAFAPGREAPLDRTAIERFFGSPAAAVTRITTSERDSRRFVHVRLDVTDVRALGAARAFDWSRYEFGRDGDLVIYRQQVGRGRAEAPPTGGWADDAIVAFRLHVPSRVVYHNAGAGNLRRGNILVWEQALGDRLAGTSVEMEVRMEPESILYRTLWLFGASALAVAATFAFVIWRLTRRRER